MTQASIPDKLYFKIGEVSDLVGVKPYVLRYWETEFKEITPVKSRTNQRLYRRKDVELLVKIADLLYKERFTINGAKQRLKDESKDIKEREREAVLSATQLGLDLGAADKTSGFTHADKLEILAELKSICREMRESLK